MRVNSRVTTSANVVDNDAGEGLAIFFSQNGDSLCRYRFLVKVQTDQGTIDLGEFYSSPPLASSIPGRLTRMVAAAVCPGAVGWTVDVQGMPPIDGGDIPPETADIILASSRCCTGPVGLTRVGERYGYDSGASGVVTNYGVLPGQKVTGIAAIGGSTGGTVVIAGGDTIPVPEGVSMNLAPEALLPPNAIIVFDNVNWIVEYLESA